MRFAIIRNVWILVALPALLSAVARAESAAQLQSDPQVPDTAAAATDPMPLSAREQAWHVLNRLAFGPQREKLAELTKGGWRPWVEQQLEPEKIDDSALERRLERDYPSLKMGMGEAYGTYWPPVPVNWKALSPEEQNQFNQKRAQLREQIQRELRDSVLVRAIFSRRQFKEVMVEFWRNHFNIDQTKDECRFFANHYEESVIRKHVFGKFRHMLMASARHPAMLIYLDNDVSQKPLTLNERARIEKARRDVRRGRSHGVSRDLLILERQSGLNENYARELMELHTLGVDNYYKQRDVFDVARTLTGWTHGWLGKPYESEY